MKRVATIFLSCLLLLMLVYAGGGVTVVRCLHAGTIRVVHAVSQEKGGGRKCCEESGCMRHSSCMEISVEQMSPSLEAAKTTPGGAVHWFFLPVQERASGFRDLLPQEADIPVPYTSRGIPLPPRFCLNLRCSLLI